MHIKTSNIYFYTCAALMSLIKTKDGALVEGEDGETITTPHPFRIAENALKQMHYAKFTGQPANQSIIISGESGAGKTEAAKRVLQRLVSTADHQYSSGNDKNNKSGRRNTRSDKGGDPSLDRRLLDTNPVLEAFGNATTLRNPNSSR
jgi:myosin heavy subunit